MSNKTEEALRREVAIEIIARAIKAVWDTEMAAEAEASCGSMDYEPGPWEEWVNEATAAFDALRDHYQAPKHANKPEQCCAKCGSLRLEPVDGQARPTFEGDDANVRAFLLHLMEEWPINAKLALALLDAKDAEIASNGAASSMHFEWYQQARQERDAALSRAEQAERERDEARVQLSGWHDRYFVMTTHAEQAEAALAEERKAMSEAASYAVEDLREWLVNYPDAYDRDTTEQAITTLSRFILPAKPAVDPLVEVMSETFDASKDDPVAGAANLRAAIERRGGVKAVFGEGV